MKLIYIIGTDGAGKTTAAKRVAGLNFPGQRVKYLYCQHQPLLLWILKLPAGLLFMRRTDQFKNYSDYKARKDSVSSKRPVLTQIYAFLWYLDVLLQTWPKMIWARWTTDIVFVDRYYLDWVVNLGVLNRNSLDRMLRDASWLERLLPRANQHIFLDVSEETAFQRKNDIQSVQYLRERKERYLHLAPHYGFQVVDANQDAGTVYQQVRALVETPLTSSAAAVMTAAARQ